MENVIGVRDLMDKKFKCYPYTGPWLESFGEPEVNFTVMIYGESGNGKTEFVLQWVKYMCEAMPNMKVDFYSFEQGFSKTLQDGFKRNKMHEVGNKVMLIAGGGIDMIVERLSRRNEAKLVVIDSIDYMKMTKEQYQMLIERFPRKSFIIISWIKNGKPKTQAARDIEFMCDIKIIVKDYKAYPKCRFGGNEPFTIWDKHPKKGNTIQGNLHLMNNDLNTNEHEEHTDITTQCA